MSLTLGPILLLALAQAVLSPLGGVLSATAPLDQGYRQMYDLQFDGAHRTFQNYEQAHSEDPLGPTSDAAAYLYSEFEHLGIFQTELFVDDEMFLGRKKPTPDQALREAFTQALAKSDQKADAILSHSPGDRNALLAKVFNWGLEADYLSMVEKRDLAAVGYAKRAGQLADQLLAIAPDCYEAYLATGVENYVLGLRPAPVRWLLRLYGAQTDKNEGVRKVGLTAEKGHYLLPYARLLLAVAALRDNDRNRAKDLLRNLAQEFPDNHLYQRELDRLQ
jgi:hypothetical protein